MSAKLFANTKPRIFIINRCHVAAYSNYSDKAAQPDLDGKSAIASAITALPNGKAAQPDLDGKAAQPDLDGKAAQPNPGGKVAQPNPGDKAAQPNPGDKAAQPNLDDEHKNAVLWSLLTSMDTWMRGPY